MFLLEHGDETGGLGVESAGNVRDGVGDEVSDAGVGDGRFVGELVVAASGAGGVEEGFGFGHAGWWGGGGGGGEGAVGMGGGGEWVFGEGRGGEECGGGERVYIVG